MGIPSFGAPPPFEYKPPSVVQRYRGLLILFVVIFLAAIAVSRYIIRVRRDQLPPPGPVYLENLDAPERPGSDAR